VAIANGTLAAAVGLGLQLWIPGVVLWIVGHSLAVWGARVDPQFMQVFARHIKHRRCWTCRDAAMLNLAEYRQRPPCWPTGCPGPGWSRRASC
jgi:hypothetical protein